MATNLQDFARRADEAETMLATLQRQMDYLSTVNPSQSSMSSMANGGVSLSKSVDIEDVMLLALSEEKSVDSRDFAQTHHLTANDVYGAINSLEAEGYVVKKQKQTASKLTVSSEGIAFIEHGSPECILMRLLLASSANPVAISSVQRRGILEKDKMFKVAQNKCCKNKWIRIDKKTQTIHKLVDSMRDEIKEQLLTIQSSGDVSSFPPKVLKELKSRKLLVSKCTKYFVISRGDNYAPQRKPQIKDITLDVLNQHLDLETNEWTGPEIKPLNFNAKGGSVSHGSLHPLMKMRCEMRRILLDMGFEEMETNRFVESSFWNFDALFQPQQHPARDAHDTFFLRQPQRSQIASHFKGYMKRVKKTHTEGGYGSIGWRYDWKESEAQKNLLRTHTTAVSSRTLYQLAQLKPFRPKKCFSIDRVFRNESIDATHLAEFHQIEGWAADYDLTLGHLLGVIAEFFRRIGIPDVRFKPAYNPYTEPSMEIFGWSTERKDWIEVGNSGVFRPEMLEPMGLPKNVNVIAWGLGLERPCMIATKVKDIRELFGPRVDINMVRTFPIVRYEDSGRRKDKKDKKGKQTKK